ncbi:DEAD/DEAH box helicase [Methylobacterium sp. Leaf99]|uniref:DEAD/DEAH box helicase n=1 Tax=Methylobacterium sp. Leaf99 TaxID=1736251 RepID=UPI000AE179B9|nr:DEAD/DEAH box helicase [Methylobacterium sp. Leaf99]
MNNHLSFPLRQTWEGIASTYNRRIKEQFNESWDVLALPTGSGKTESLALYCSMLNCERHPGVLIVTPLKEQADSICMRINDFAAAKIAISHHTDNQNNVSQLHQAPVLAITHAGYLSALQGLAERSESHHKFLNITRWARGERLLRVVDESIEMHQTYKVTLEELSIFIGAVQHLIQFKNRGNLKCIEELCTSICTLTELEGYRERYLSEFEMNALHGIDTESLREELDGISEGNIRFGFDNGVAGGDMKRQCLRTMQTIRSLSRVGDAWITKRGKIVTISAAENMLGLESRPGVILDATAGVDTRYELIESKAQITAAVRGVRDYSNVTLWMVPDQRVGKDYMAIEGGWKRWAPLANQIQQKLGFDRQVLVCCHKDVRDRVESVQTHFAQTAYAHWGAIAGKNDWQYYDTVVIFGLNYLNRSANTESFLGMQGATNNDWLQSPACRKFNKHDDILDALKMGHLAVSVIQAVNRVRCRRTSDTFGNCERTDIILLLPSGTEGNTLVGMLQAEMPGLQTREWPIQIRTRKERGAPSKDRVFKFLRDAPNGIYTNKDLPDKLDVSKSTYDRIISDFKSDESTESKQLRLYGVRYIHNPGRGKLSGFMKETPNSV